MMKNEDFEVGRHYAIIQDNNDILGHFRQRFYLNAKQIYMCGNSLGLASKDSEEALLKVVDKWKTEGVNIWHIDNCKYVNYSNNLAALMAPLVGADDDEIAITGTTTINIHQTISTFYKPTKERYKILIDDINFPTDRYAIESQVRLKGLVVEDAIKIVSPKDGVMDEEDIINAMTDDVAVVFLPAVYYRSCQIMDMAKVTSAAKDRNIFVGWDLCHAVGALEIDLKSLDADFAVWCTYKYLNGGPGSSAALYINRKHFNKRPGLAGWFGNKTESRFQLRQEFEHEENGGGYQTGTPHIFSMATLEGSLEIFNEAGMSNIRKKSLRLTSYLMFLINKKLYVHGFKIGNLEEVTKRGGHVCLIHDEAFRISMALKEGGVVVDFREPDVIRLTPVALYTTYADVYEVANTITVIMNTESYKEFTYERGLVV